MDATAVSDAELGANMDALVEYAGLSDADIKRKLRTPFLAIREKFPELHEVKPKHWARRDPRIHNWPGVNERELVGIAICEVILSRPKNAFLREFSERNNSDYAGSRELYQLVERTDYWKFSKLLNLDPARRKQIAIAREIGAWYLWPKRDVQFIYIVKPVHLLAASGVKEAIAVTGAFSIRAPQDNDAVVEHGQAYYLLENGKVLPRGNWTSKYLGFNENQLVIHYRAEFRRGQEYGGLISLKRVLDNVVITDCDCGSFVARSNRAYRGEFDTLAHAKPADSGEIYCEELDRPIPSAAQIERLIQKSHTMLLGKLHTLEGPNVPLPA